jgi:hypothetical protein
MIVALLLTGLWSSSAAAQDEYVGAIWSVKVKNKETGQWDDFGFFRCTTDGKVYREGKVIGSHKNINLNNVQMEIKANKDGTRLGGTWKATRLKKDGRVWHGVYTRKSDGKEFVVAMILKAD